MDKIFNNSLKKNEVIVAIDNKWCEDRGGQIFAVIWDGQKVYREIVHNGYTNKGMVFVNATEDDIIDATEWYRDNVKDDSLNGATVILQRSRKAPNRIPLKVVDYREGFYNSIYNQYETAKISVSHEGEVIVVNASCIKEVVKAPIPSWGIER